MTSYTSYDEIFTCFLDNCGIDTDNLPKSNEGKYKLIHNAIIHYNTVIDESYTNLNYDDEKERVNILLDNNQLLLLAYCLRYSYLENELIEFEELWQPFQKEVGQKFYREQLQGRESTLARTQNKINELLNNMEDFDYN
ncbi:hypothetical protein G8S55_12120 [Clostridium botulinum C]|uniref:hypothetical protein n=1 Tax=Clostridium botulinum TaxID=1491 RepID=UPI001E5A6F68|nr:hypothetical protein [Clostridium botulinum]MCD3217958.1 hypothetical protein [Clostridium botulinum C]